MATFARYFKKDVTTVQSVRATTSDDILIGLNVANTAATAGNVATVDIYVTEVDSSTDIYIAENIKIPGGGNIEVVDGKIVLKTGDILKVVSDENVDVWASILEGVN